VAGNTIGAGIIALPTVSLETGFGPSTFLLSSLWAYNLATALLIAEVCKSVGDSTLCSSPKCKTVSILELALNTLGPNCGRFASSLSMFLNYLLMTAFIAQGGQLFSDAMMGGHCDYLWGSKIAFTMLMAFLMTRGSSFIERFNNGLCLVLFGSFAMMVGSGCSGISSENLVHANFAASSKLVPVAMCSLVFQNIVPMVSAQLGYKKNQVIQALTIGSAIPLIVYVIFEALVLGQIPFIAGASSLPVLNLAEMIQYPGFKEAAFYFSASALATSFIGTSCSLVPEVRQMVSSVQAPKAKQQMLNEKNFAEFFVYVPPTVLACSGADDLFVLILSAVGSLFTVLYGVLPVVMAWFARYNLDISKSDFIPGEKIGLVSLGVFSAALLFSG